MIIDDSIKNPIINNKTFRKSLINYEDFYFGGDNKDRFIRYTKNNKKFYWKDKEIIYKFNNFGYRTNEDFNKERKGIITLGCSFTEGVGIPIDWLWGYKLSNKINLPLFNLGVGGSGIRDCFERLISFGDYLNYEYIFLLTPFPGRLSYYYKDNDFINQESWLKECMLQTDYINIMPWYPQKEKRMHNDFIKWMHILCNGSDYEQEMYQFVFINLIESFCDSNGKKLITISLQDIDDLYSKNPKMNEEIEDYPARDREHWGSRKQHFIYEQFLKKYEELNSNRTS